MSGPRLIYMDHNATTPLDPRILQAMMPYLTEHFGNASSTSHVFGLAAAEAVEAARESTARLLGCAPAEIVFTSGATESDNTAIKGVAWALEDKGRHIITTSVEHRAVLEACSFLESRGFEVTILPVDRYGVVDPDDLRRSLRTGTILVSVMHGNSEVGSLQPVEDIGAICREKGILFHVDATQTVGKLPVEVERLGADFVAFSGHKIYGPKGIGALYVRRKPPLALKPLIYGGGQEHGIRSGTLPTHQIVGMGLAFEIGAREREQDMARIGALRDRLWAGIQSIGDVELNGHAQERVAVLLNVSFHGVEGESLQFALRELAVSAGSACSSASEEASYVLRALGHSDQLAQSSLRFSLGRFTTSEQIDIAVAAVKREVTRLRSFSPQTTGPEKKS